MENKKYTDDFHPRKGDRVYCKGIWSDLVKGIVDDIVEDKVIVKWCEITSNRKCFNAKDLYFRYERPWYAIFG